MPVEAKPTTRVISYAESIQEATSLCLRADQSVLVVGEGVTDPKGIFGTTLGLQQEFGPNRIVDMPLSENGMTGILIGLALSGFRPILVHQRVDFSLLAMDQMVNNAAKWHFMFNGMVSVPMVIRVLIGRGWGQGPQHSQSLQALFAHIPGFKVVLPSSPADAKGLLISSIEDNNPVIFIEHRWLHEYKEEVPEGVYRTPIGKARIARRGKHVTVAAFSYMVVEALKCAEVLKDFGLELEVVDMRSASPLDTDAVAESLRLTGHLVVLDTAWKKGGIAAELISQIVEREWQYLKKAPLRIALPDHPIPTTHDLADLCYPEADQIAQQIMEHLGKKTEATTKEIVQRLKRKGPLDVPDFNFKGPF